MRRAVEIVRNTLSAILRTRVVYLGLLAVVLLVALSLLPVAMMQMAVEAGEEEMARQLQTNLLSTSLALWSGGTFVLAAYLGATAVSTEVKSGTIVTVLAKPVERWRFLASKWLAIQIFSLASMLLGIGLVTVLLIVFGLSPAPLFWLGVAAMCVSVVVASSTAVALATVVSPVVAGGLPVLFGMIGGAATSAMDFPSAWVRIPATVLYYLVPARMPDNLLRLGLSLDLLDPSYGLYVSVLAENLAYGLLALGLACWVFSRRSLRLD